MAFHDSPPPEYVSDRLILRRFDDDDAEFVLGLHAHPGIARFIPSAVMSSADDALGLDRRGGDDERPRSRTLVRDPP
ncbi:hypothetical protein M3B92_14850 [Brevibacterium casei]|uniref:hypothetical protein n=1 Tax=Brevibacterium casei TaxID=33889 RepID=UPI00223B92B2|nr:hypothetical protein [Brevibacterium casei]MCT1446803.1 hypothetical protein [Brevibacterium casei]MCT1767392.1 hypothetical protein [Brevibacterium casei]